MKKCLACLHENSDDMSFCLNCGKPLAQSPAPGWLGTEAKTASFAEIPTTVRQGGFETQANPAQFATAAPQSKGSKKLLVAAGGIAVVVLFLIAAGAAVVGYNYYSSRGGTTPPPPDGNKTWTNKNSASPGGSPSANTAPTPSVSFTPPIEPTKSGSFTVFANGGWQLSDIDTVALENFRTKVDGKVDISGVKTGVLSSGVNDAGSKSRRIYPEYPTGALLMRTHYADGKFSNVMAVSANGSNGQWRNFQDELGKMEFCINDNAPAQNGGQFTISVTMTNVPKAKK